MSAILKEKVKLLAPVFIADDGEVRVPGWVVDLPSFRRWTDRDDFPEKGKICYLYDLLWIDMSKEQLFTHIQIKHKYSAVLDAIVENSKAGYWFGDGARLSHPGVGLSTVPDGLFVSFAALETGRIRLIDAVDGGPVELEGTPDMVLEVVSPGSVQKDTQVLRKLYAAAGIAEYWLVDARGDTPQFDILRLAGRKYVATRKEAGWVGSKVFGKSFLLVKQQDKLGHPSFTLKVRS